VLIGRQEIDQNGLDPFVTDVTQSADYLELDQDFSVSLQGIDQTVHGTQARELAQGPGGTGPDLGTLVVLQRLEDWLQGLLIPDMAQSIEHGVLNDIAFLFIL
jgi:hypothetical protein